MDILSSMDFRQGGRADEHGLLVCRHPVPAMGAFHLVSVDGNAALLYVSSRLRTGCAEAGFLYDGKEVDRTIRKICVGKLCCRHFCRSTACE